MQTASIGTLALEWEPVNLHHFATVKDQRKRSEAALPAAQFDITRTMARQTSATRKDVARMLAQYVRLKEGDGPKSLAGRLVIDESRSRRRSIEPVNLEDMSVAEIFDAIRHAEISRAVNAKPSVPVHASGEWPLRAVAPTEAIAQIVRSHPSRSAAQTAERRAKVWTVQVGVCLKRMARRLLADGVPLEEAFVVVRAEKNRQERVEVRNQLQAARTTMGRLRNGGRNARNLRRHAEERVAELRSREQLLTDRISVDVRSRAYRRGMDHLFQVCTATAEIEREVFGDLS